MIWNLIARYREWRWKRALMHIVNAPSKPSENAAAQDYLRSIGYDTSQLPPQR